MVIPVSDSQGNVGGTSGGFKELPFLLTGGVEFGPTFPPERIQIEKERELNRKQNMCKGEDVSDEGSKNREIHVSGLVRKGELNAFNMLLEFDEPLDLITAGWSGEVHVRKGDFEGPVRYDPQNNEWLFEYTVDLVSTGREEGGAGNGIISGSSGTNSASTSEVTGGQVQ